MLEEIEVIELSKVVLKTYILHLENNDLDYTYYEVK